MVIWSGRLPTGALAKQYQLVNEIKFYNYAALNLSLKWVIILLRVLNTSQITGIAYRDSWAASYNCCFRDVQSSEGSSTLHGTCLSTSSWSSRAS
jgi:hypothetical protein